MKNAIHVLDYIVKNNPWYVLPQRLLLAIFYQCYKRLTKGVVTKALFNGKKIFLYPHNPICSAFVYCSYPDKAEILALRQLADENTIFLDVGANVGSFCLQLADKVKKIYAFEAHPFTANCCKMNFLLNQISENQVITKAISDNTEPKLFSNRSHASPTNGRVESTTDAIYVPATTLDKFMQEQQFDSKDNFILKVDVEGFEHEVFNGATTLLADPRLSAILFETFSPENNAIQALLTAAGFKLQYLGNNNILARRHHA